MLWNYFIPILPTLAKYGVEINIKWYCLHASIINNTVPILFCYRSDYNSLKNKLFIQFSIFKKRPNTSDHLLFPISSILLLWFFPSASLQLKTWSISLAFKTKCIHREKSEAQRERKRVQTSDSSVISAANPLPSEEF